MKTIENRSVEIIYCDFCGEETKAAEKCAICSKEGCSKDGGKTHFSYAIEEIYRYKDSQEAHVKKICHECAAKKLDPDQAIGNFFDAFFSR